MTSRPGPGDSLRHQRWALSLILFTLTLGSVSLGALGWGSWTTGYLAHPARAAAVGLLLTLAPLATTLTGVNVSSGKREDVRNRWILLPLILVSLPVCWLPPYLDRRELWVIDGDPVRYLGLALLIGGGALRVWPMFVLGRRFSGLVAIQEHHELVTTGIYHHIRHPSYGHRAAARPAHLQADDCPHGRGGGAADV